MLKNGTFSDILQKLKTFCFAKSCHSTIEYFLNFKKVKKYKIEAS